MQHFFQFVQIIITKGEASVLALAFVVAIGNQSAGLVYSRQRPFFLFACGLVGLTGFLMNPIADSNTMFDLQAKLSSPDLLLALCACQLLLSAACLTAALRTVSGNNRDRWQTTLGFLSCIPSPVVVISALLIEQQWLASEVGARPELAGIGVGSTIALIMIVGCVIGSFLKTNFVLRIHIISCLSLCTLAGLLTTLNQSLPEVKQAQSLWQMVLETGLALLIALICISVGFLLGRNQQTQMMQAVANNKSS